MTRSQAIKKLRREGYAATVGRVRQAIENGYVKPLPLKVARGAYDFQPEHLKRLRWYMTHIRPGSRALRAPSLPICGVNDRMHRLKRAKVPRAESPARRSNLERRQQSVDEAIARLEGIVAAPDCRLSALPLLSASERRQLLETWNQTDTDYPGDAAIHQLFEAQVAAVLQLKHAQWGHDRTP